MEKGKREFLKKILSRRGKDSTQIYSEESIFAGTQSGPSYRGVGIFDGFEDFLLNLEKKGIEIREKGKIISIRDFYGDYTKIGLPLDSSSHLEESLKYSSLEEVYLFTGSGRISIESKAGSSGSMLAASPVDIYLVCTADYLIPTGNLEKAAKEIKEIFNSFRDAYKPHSDKYLPEGILKIRKFMEEIKKEN
ncbi:hypothetical protein DRN73_03025 [Candidatus Pacearchaeota archaeon]|nr:MAG: hypothetical protein DRN73_03025 [Candidatus Pacearchaeota archaeon]